MKLSNTEKEAALIAKAQKKRDEARAAALKAQELAGKAAALKKKRLTRGKILFCAAVLEGISKKHIGLVRKRNGAIEKIKLTELLAYLTRESDKEDLAFFLESIMPDVMAC